MKEPRISVVATEALLEALIGAAKALRSSRKKDGISPAVLNALIVQVSTARGTFEHAQKVKFAAEVEAGNRRIEKGLLPFDAAEGKHPLRQGETEWMFHQDCTCQRCRAAYEQVARAQSGLQTV